MRSCVSGAVRLLCTLTLVLGWACALGEPLRFFALGDMPYSPSEVEPMQALMRDAERAGTPFIVHVGDIKRGSAPCTDANLEQIAGIFRSLSVPVVYTPGDNEWTDCHRPSAGGLDPLVRLARVREVFFADPGVLRLPVINAVAEGPVYPEDYYFEHRGVMFVALHVVGSNNGLDSDNERAMSEYRARDAANRAFLQRAAEAATSGGAQALVVLMQADLQFGSDRAEGFDGVKAELVALKDRFAGPILLLHGDSHRFIHDRPFIDPESGEPIRDIERVEVPGSPIIGGVWITVDARAGEPFSAEPVYAVSIDALGD